MLNHPGQPRPSAPGIAIYAAAVSIGVALAAAAASGGEPVDAALSSDRPWTRFLAQAFPEEPDPDRSLDPPSIREPGADTAHYPNSPDTLPRGGAYLEWSPVFFTNAMTAIQPQTYNAEFLLRLGLTDRFEFRLYSSGFTSQAVGRGAGVTTGFSPLVFDTKFHLWDENEEWFIPATAIEAFIQSPWGSPAFNSGVPSGLAPHLPTHMMTWVTLVRDLLPM